MTLVEMAVTVLLLGIALFLLAGLARTTRQKAKKQLAVRALVVLDDALSAYEQRYGKPPAGRPDGSAEKVIAALFAYGPSSAKLELLPAVLHRGQGPTRSLVDPWATPFRYVTSAHALPAMRARVAGNAGRPIFDSAGPDRRFASSDSGEEDDLFGEECLLQPGPM